MKHLNRLALTFLSIFSFIACNQSSKNTSANGAASASEATIPDTVVTLSALQEKNAALVMAFPQKIAMHTTLKATGVVDVPPQSLNSISVPMGGYLKSTGLLPGSSVQKGSALAVMEDQVYVQLQQDYLTAKAKMEYLQPEMQRQKDLSEQDATSKKSYQLSLSDYKVQQVTLRALEEKLRIIGINPAGLTVSNISKSVVLRSPINGFVTKVNVNVGKYVNPSDVLFEIVDPSDIHAAINIFEKDLTAVQNGTKGWVWLSDKPEKKYRVNTILVTRSVNENATGLLHCHFEQAGKDLLPGMFLNAEMETTQQEVIAVPNDAVLRFEGKYYVFLSLGNKKYKMQQVELIATQNGLTGIGTIHGINWLEQKVVVKNAYALLGALKNKAEE